MVLKGLSSKNRREEDAEEIVQPLPKFKINWDVFTQEILTRLPAYYLQTFKLVSRNWFQMISSPYFVRLHLDVYNQTRIRVLISRHSEMMIEYNTYYEETKQIPYPPALIRKRDSKILGSCDGLLCLHIHPAFAVYNPSTGKYISVHYSPGTHTITIKCSWFGHHPSSKEYVLVLGILTPGSGCKVGVYKFSPTSFLQLTHSTSFCIHPQIPSTVFFSHSERGTLLHGALHWPTIWVNHPDRSFRSAISVYHLHNNKYSEISAPAPAPVQNDFKLGVSVEGCLFAIFKPIATRECTFEMWVMKEYGAEQSWTIHANIEGFIRHRDLSPLGIFPNGDLVLDVDKYMLVKYSFQDNKAIPLMDHDYCNSGAIMCADSLVSPNIVREGGVE